MTAVAWRLRTQIALLVLGGLSVAQALSLWLFVDERSLAVQAAIGAEAAGRAANVAQLIEGAPMDLHAQIISAATSPLVRFELSELPTVIHELHDDGGAVKARVRAFLGDSYSRDIRVEVHEIEQNLLPLPNLSPEMAEMHAELTPGMTERELWAMLHAGNIRRAGEWVETQIIASGPRTNPWMQEASSRVIEAGDLVAYDTDLVVAYVMMVDVSRTWLAGADAEPSAQQQQTFELACGQIEQNMELLTPGRSFRDLTFDATFPDPEQYRHYSCLFHGVGQCDEYPEIYFPEIWDEWGFDGELQPGMVLTVESYVGPRSPRGAAEWAEGVKLENQVLVTADGPELLTHFPLDLKP